jgi:peptide/nickel transport system substrate-binding protein
MSTSSEFRRRRGVPVGWLIAGAVVVIAIVVIIVLASGGSDDDKQAATSAPAAAGGGTLVTAALASPDPLDPHINAPTYARAVRLNVYDPLVRYKPGGVDLEPALATKWEASSDGLTYTFTLRKGVVFQDGKPMDSSDVQASYQRALHFSGQPSMGGIYLSDVDSTEAPSPDTFVIHLKKPYGLFLGVVPKIAITSEDDLKAHGGSDDAQTWFKDHANGTGPYSFTDYRRGTSYTLVRNAKYWGTLPKGAYDKIIVRVLPDSSAVAQQLERGELDYGAGMTMRDMVTADKSDKVKLVKPSPYPTMGLIGSLNAGRPPLNNLKVRQAIMAAFPYADMKGFYQGFGVDPTSLLPGSWPGAKQYPAMQQDLAKAKQLLSDAGYGAGKKPVTLRYVAFQGLEDTRQAGLLLQDALKQIGVKLNVDVLPFATFFAQAQKMKTAPDISPGYESPETNDAFFWMRKLTGKAGFYNLTFTNDPELDKTLDQGQAASDASQQEDLLHKAQDLIQKDAVIIPMANFDQPGIVSSSVEGVSRNFTELLDVPNYSTMFRGSSSN